MSMVFMQFSIYFLEHRDQAGESYALDIDTEITAKTSMSHL